MYRLGLAVAKVYASLCVGLVCCREAFAGFAHDDCNRHPVYISPPVPCPRAREQELDLIAKWEASSWAKKRARSAKRSSMTDFDRFKVHTIQAQQAYRLVTAAIFFAQSPLGLLFRSLACCVSALVELLDFAESCGGCAVAGEDHGYFSVGVFVRFGFHTRRAFPLFSFLNASFPRMLMLGVWYGTRSEGSRESVPGMGYAVETWAWCRRTSSCFSVRLSPVLWQWLVETQINKRTQRHESSLCLYARV